MSSGCASCSGRCCYDIVVRVTPLDIWRIARAQRLAFDEIVVPWREPEPTPVGVQIDAISVETLSLADEFLGLLDLPLPGPLARTILS